jgi:hypothetical protein
MEIIAFHTFSKTFALIYTKYYCIHITSLPQSPLYCAVKAACNISLQNSGFEHQTEENLKWGKLNTEISNLSFKLKAKCGKILK